MSYGDFRRVNRPGDLPRAPVNRAAAVLSLAVMAGILASVVWLVAPVIAHVWGLLM